MKHLVFIVNPISGIGRQRKIEKVLASTLDKSLFSYEIRYTEHMHHGTEIAREEAQKGTCDAVVAVGGDGSVNDIAAGLQGYDMTMGIIPCGSGNGLARDLKIPLNPTQAVKMINNFYTQPIDTVMLNDILFVSIAGIGFDALVARKMKLAKKRGLSAYVNIVLNDYPLSKESTFRLVIDGQEIERTAWIVSFANSNQFGYNTAIAPLAQLDDGLLDICVVNKIPLAHLPLTAPLVYLNKFDMSQHVEIFKAKEVTVLNNDYRWVNVDGEGLRIGDKLHFKVLPKSLNLITPGPKTSLFENIESRIEDLERRIDDSRYFRE
ncbi:MAG: diacylglycerol kinase family lipid kinase [Bacteroidales bacterium]|nr:diacylglycerol kinase family lipid kinase [Bacteroidales bacterium]